MGKASRKMFSTIYENDVLNLDTVEELEITTPLKSNRSIKQAKKENKSRNSQTKSKNSDSTTNTPSKSLITKPVDATCNKCGCKIVGDLIGDIYINGIEKIMPLISYTCEGCGHIGRRSVITLALAPAQYERKYFA